MLRAISVIPMLLAALILHTDRSIVRQLRRAGAASEDQAVRLRVPPAIGRWRLRRLTGVGALVEAASGRYFLREEWYAAYRQQRRRRVLIVIVALMVVAGVAWVWRNL